MRRLVETTSLAWRSKSARRAASRVVPRTISRPCRTTATRPSTQNSKAVLRSKPNLILVLAAGSCSQTCSRAAGVPQGSGRPSPHAWACRGEVIAASPATPLGAVGCRSVAVEEESGTPLDHVRRAVELASDSGSFRVRGEVRASVPIVAWEGVVVGSDEELTTQASGMLIESRRIGGRSWGRRLDPTGPWGKSATTGPWISPSCSKVGPSRLSTPTIHG